jgi:hypothetical protein
LGKVGERKGKIIGFIANFATPTLLICNNCYHALAASG